MWKQRSWTKWLQLRDKNTIFFHSKASNRRRKNHIGKIQDAYKVQVNDKDEMEDIIMGYFIDIFTSSSSLNLNNVLDGVTPYINSGMATLL